MWCIRFNNRKYLLILAQQASQYFYLAMQHGISQQLAAFETPLPQAVRCMLGSGHDHSILTYCTQIIIVDI